MAKPSELMIRAVAELSPEVTQLLTEIRDRLPGPGKSQETPGARPTQFLRKTAQTQALHAVGMALNGWVEGARENHEAHGHPQEPVGDECWRQFSTSDIRAMINDAARELGLQDL